MAETGIFAEYYYNRIIRKMVVAFGSLFNNVQIVRHNKAGTIEIERLLVPLVWGQKEKWILRNLQDPNLTKNIQISLPRMAFELTGISYDSSRQQNTLQSSVVLTGNTNTFKRQYMGVPYNFGFSLTVFTRNIEDGAQIIEQITPLFNPQYTLNLLLDDVMGTYRDVPIILDNIKYRVEDEGDGETIRLIEWTLSFTAKGFMYSPASNTGIIKTATTTISTTRQLVPSEQIVVLNMSSTGNNEYFDNEIVYQGPSNLLSNTQAQVIDWDTLNNKLYVKDVVDRQGNPALFTVNTQIIGAQSRAVYNLSSYYVSNIPLANITVRVTPNTALANGIWNTTTTIVETP